MTDATHLREDFEALMPEPAAHRYMSHGHSSRWQLAGRAVPPDAEPLYTADQMREAIRAATERAAKVERADGAIVAAYALPTVPGAIDQIRIERARQMFGPDLWAVRYRGDVLNKAGEWEWEPMPSGRDEEFLARARFDNAEEAIAAAIRNGGAG